MKKGLFYPKLAAGNLWRNRSTYLPYLLACVVSVFTFYTMLSINLNGALNGIRAEGVVRTFTFIGTIILGIFCTILIFYTNSFLIKRRKRELGLYAILGMEKRNIAVLMLWETLFVAVLALVAGLLLGVLLSRLLFWVLLRMIRFDVVMDMPVEPAALGVTAALFAGVFLLTLLSNLWQVRRANPIELMAGAKQGEKEPRASLLVTVLGVACLAGGYFIALHFKSPTEALMFFLFAAFLVIIGTFCLFTSGSIAVLKLLRRNKRYYYQPSHFISVSGMIYRMKQNAAGLATICILSCMVLVTVSSTVSLNLGSDDSLLMQYPNEYDIRFNVPEDGDILLAGAEQIAAESSVQLADVRDYERITFMAVERQDGFSFSNDDSDLTSIAYFQLMTLDDYNRNEGQTVTLAQDEALLLVTGGSYEGESITVDGRTYRLWYVDVFGKAEAGDTDISRNFIMVLKDRDEIGRITGGEGQAPDMTRVLQFDLEGAEAEKAQFAASYNTFVDGLTTQDYFSYRSRENARQEWYASNGGFLFLGLYFGILFLLAAALIIYYKQLSEGYDDAGRFEILQKVGMSEAEVKKTINGQILAVFFLPLLVAVIHIAVAFFPISRVMVIFGVVNIPLLVAATALTVLAYALLYLIVFRRTAKTYFHIVRRETAA